MWVQYCMTYWLLDFHKGGFAEGFYLSRLAVSIGDQKIWDRQAHFFPDRLAKCTPARTSWVLRGKKEPWAVSRGTKIFFFRREGIHRLFMMPFGSCNLGNSWRKEGCSLALGLKPAPPYLQLCWTPILLNPFSLDSISNFSSSSQRVWIFRSVIWHPEVINVARYKRRGQ